VFLPQPNGFRDAARVTERQAMLATEQSVQPLRAWAEDLAARRNVVVPQFDPAEAGVDAKVLFLLEAPGPMTNAGNARPGSGFISVDNHDATAANSWRARDAAGLHDGVLHWNIVPWYLGTAKRKPTRAELKEGGAELRELLTLLPYLEVVVLSGLYAQAGWAGHVARHAADGLTVVPIWHPGNQSLNQPGRRDEFNQSVRDIAAFVS
jgi:hypothetical protein